MSDIPAPRETDAEEVASALRAASTLWRCHEHVAAIGWMRRAGQAANEAGDEDRAVELAAIADDLARDLAQQMEGGAAASPSQSAAFDDLADAAINIDLDTLSEPSERAEASSLFDEEATVVRSGRLARVLSRAPSLQRVSPELVAVPESVSEIAEGDDAEIVTVQRASTVKKADSGLSPSALDLVAALADLPDETRARLAGEAHVTEVALAEVVSGFFLAVVLSGEVDVCAEAVEGAVARVCADGVITTTGTLGPPAPMRLVGACASSRVATWSREQIEPVMASCPWVGDELSVAANRLVALVAVMSGPLGAAITAGARSQLAEQLRVRALMPSEVVWERGVIVSQLVVVAAGALETLDAEGQVVGTVATAERMFADEFGAAEAAPATVRAAAGGALVLVADRSEVFGLALRHPSLAALLS